MVLEVEVYLRMKQREKAPFMGLTRSLLQKAPHLVNSFVTILEFFNSLEERPLCFNFVLDLTSNEVLASWSVFKKFFIVFSEDKEEAQRRKNGHLSGKARVEAALGYTRLQAHPQILSETDWASSEDTSCPRAKGLPWPRVSTLYPHTPLATLPEWRGLSGTGSPELEDPEFRLAEDLHSFPTAVVTSSQTQIYSPTVWILEVSTQSSWAQSRCLQAPGENLNANSSNFWQLAAGHSWLITWPPHSHFRLLLLQTLVTEAPSFFYHILHHSPRARHPGMWSQVCLRKHHYEQS